MGAWEQGKHQWARGVWRSEGGAWRVVRQREGACVVEEVCPGCVDEKGCVRDVMGVQRKRWRGQQPGTNRHCTPSCGKGGILQK